MKKKQLIDDDSLLNRIADGDEAAFTTLFYAFLPKLQPYVNKLSNSQAETEEVIQDVFLKLWLNREKLRGVTNISSYIYKYTSNECLHLLRKRIYERKWLLAMQQKKESFHELTKEEIQLRELHKAIQSIVSNMPQQRRIIFSMSRYEHLTVAQIAERLQLSESTVKNTLVTCLKQLKQQLPDYGWSYVLLAIILFRLQQLILSDFL